MHDFTSYNWSHWNSNKKLKEKSVSCTGKTFDRFTTAGSCTGNITHNTESTAVWNLSVSGGGHRWFKGSTGKKRRVTRDNNNSNENNNNAHFLLLGTTCRLPQGSHGGRLLRQFMYIILTNPISY
jgi:hypothetical protein